MSESVDSRQMSWRPECGGIMVQEGDRVGVMRAFGMQWVTASLLADYKIGFDYTNKIDLLNLLCSRHQRHRGKIFFNLESMEWCTIDYVHGHFGDLHIAQTMDDDNVFLLTLLVERTAQILIKVVARAKARWLMRMLRREVTNNLNRAGLVCKRLHKVTNNAELRSELCRRLSGELVQSRFGQ